jgi:hypothetical protein
MVSVAFNEVIKTKANTFALSPYTTHESLLI